VLDLKSFALLYLVESVGLANPVRFTWLLNSTNIAIRSDELSGPSDVVIQRNFDPVSLQPSPYVDFLRFTYVVWGVPGPFFPEGSRDASEIGLLSQGETPRYPVAAYVPNNDFLPLLHAGEYFSALTRDDVGGIRYLLSRSNINVEPCLPTIRGVGGNTFVNVAARPGVEKITFQRYDPGQAQITNSFLETYVVDGQQRTQMLQRVIETPDILFTASNHPRQGDAPAIVRRTRPNFSHQNENGSGILQPEVVISFQKLGDIYREPYWSDGIDVVDWRWSTFDFRTVTPSPIFPVGPAYQSGRTLSTRQIQDQNGPAVEWKLRLIAGVQYAIETSPDLTNWTNITNITAAPIHTLTNSLANQSQTFWRARRISQ
jgi:hypothetical protein